jgi:ElaB/YqjD/DUF883 family membrane-anchored ribosome-binding protein
MHDDKDMETLRADIEQTRQRISGEVEAIGARLTPEHAREVAKERIVEAKDRAIENVKTSARSAVRVAGRTGGEIGHAIRDNPIPTALVGLGAGWLLFKAFQRAREVQQLELPLELGPTTEPLGYEESFEIEERGRLHSAKDRLSHAASSAKSRVRDATEHARERVSEKAHVARERATDLAHRGRERAEVAWGKTNDAYGRNPLAFGAVAIAAGFGLGMLIPSTEREKELLGERRERVLSRAREVASKAQNIAIDSAKEGMKAASGTAKEEMGEFRRELR